MTIEATAVLAERRFGVRGVPTRIVLMLLGGFFLLEALLLVATVSGPVNQVWQRISALAHNIGITEAWSFLGVFAAFVVAIQVTAWGNQQVGDRIARVRSSRFTGAAIFTGSITVACWGLFTVAFNTESTGQYLLLTAGTAGIVFFAADGASIVLRQDRRRLLRSEVRETTRALCSVLYREYAFLRYPAGVVVVCAAAFLGWSVIISAGALTMLALLALWSGERVKPDSWVAAYGPIATIVGFAIVAAVGSVVSFLSWTSRRRRKGPKATVSGDVSHLIASISCAVLAIIVSMYFPTAAIIDGQDWTVVVGLLGVVVAPATLPFAALIGLNRPSPKRNWWTPRGSLRVGVAAAGRTYVQSQFKTINELEALFEAPQ